MIDLTKTLMDEWKSRKLPDAIERDVRIESYASMKPKKIIVITGFRRVGKTYLMLSMARKILQKNSREEVVYINLEDERIPTKTDFLTSLLPEIKQLCSHKLKFLLLDELQNIPQWSKWLRRVYDTEDITIFVTGSSSKMSGREIPTELRGRFLEVRLMPLSFREFLRFKGLIFQPSEILTSEEQTMIKKQLNEYLNFGGMPEVTLASEDKKLEILHSYYDTVIRRDIIERFKVKNEESLKTLLRLLLNTTSYSISKMYNTLKSLNFEVGKGTIQRYLEYAKDSYFIHNTPMFSFNMKDQMQYARKLYLADTGFITALSSKFSKNTGRKYENLIFLELKRRAGPDTEICYWKSNQGDEADFALLEKGKVTQIIQSCYDIDDYDTRKRELRALTKASSALKCNKLLVITEEKEGKEAVKGKKINYAPLWKWLMEK